MTGIDTGSETPPVTKVDTAAEQKQEARQTVASGVQKELINKLMEETVQGVDLSSGNVRLADLYDQALKESIPIMLMAMKNLQIQDQQSEIDALRQKLEEGVYKDEQTKMFNKNAYFALLPKLIEDARRNLRKLGALFLDLNKLKIINDENGHQAGDAYIEKMAETVLQNIRKGDYAFRVGGDEVVILLPNAEADGVEAVASKLGVSLDLAGVSAAIGGGEVDVTTNETARKSLNDIDAIMYASKDLTKKEGKNIPQIIGKANSQSAAA